MQLQNPIMMIQQFMQFFNEYKSNPQRAQQEVQELIRTGQMSQHQLNQLQDDAKKFVGILQAFQR